MNTFQIIRASTEADEFDGNVFQIIEWTIGHLIDVGDFKAVNAFYRIPNTVTGRWFEHAILKWANKSLKGEFVIRQA